MDKETRRLYLENPYQVEFEAVVLERVLREQTPGLILDQTCFYPESGGQLDDRGRLNGTAVIRVLEDDGRIVHLLEAGVEAERIKGVIDWKRRFDHMQQHTGQHILSQSFYQFLQGETLSFHMGETSSTVEIDVRKISEEEVEEVERRANTIIFANREVKVHSVPEDRALTFPLRKLPKRKGMIRVVEVADFDYSACGGTHVRRSGEVGLIKVLKWERIRDNFRFEFVCGQRAAEDYACKNRILRDLSNRLSAHERDVLASVEKLFSDLKSEKRASRKLKERLIQHEARDFNARTRGPIIKEIFTERTAEELRVLALNIIRKAEKVVLFGLKTTGRGHLVLACSEKFPLDMRELVPEVSALVKGRGGGSPSLVEMVAEEPEKIDLALNRARERLESDLKDFYQKS